MNHKKLKKTYKPGQQWQYRLIGTRLWNACWDSVGPAWIKEFEYRIKPMSLTSIWSIWNSIEMYALGSELSYKEYCVLHKESGIPVDVVSKLSYKKLNRILRKDQVQGFLD